jgi:hypothetical protein
MLLSNEYFFLILKIYHYSKKKLFQKNAKFQKKIKPKFQAKFKKVLSRGLFTHKINQKKTP